jgi:2-C-methyl-D-erythritol 4-phosphate cytidylyltransferase
MIYAAVLAGGTGTRMGADKPKQFLEFGGKPVIVHTVERFLECDKIDRVIVMTPAEWCDYTRNLLMRCFGGPSSVAGGEKPDGAGKDSGESTRITVAAGGPTRNETLMNAISVIEADGSLDDETAIVTHDAVRPFVTERMIRENIAAARRTGACETAFPATDTIIETGDGRYVTEVPDRSRLWMVQTPQTFRAKKLRELYMSMTEEEKEVLTDAARIYVMKGEPVEIVKGESWNIKITYPQDIEIAEAILRRTR